MRRLLLTLLGASLLALAVPVAALAQGHAARHHRSRHAGSHRHHARTRVLSFHAAATPAAPAGGGQSGSSAPPAGSEPTAPVGEAVGKIASFTGGVLTITLNDGSSVSGKVTEETEIHCVPASVPGGEPGQGDDAGEHQDAARASSARADGPGPSSQGEDSGQDGEDDGQSGEDDGQSCSTSALHEGTTVVDAELALTATGAVWRHLDLRP